MPLYWLLCLFWPCEQVTDCNWLQPLTNKISCYIYLQQKQGIWLAVYSRFNLIEVTCIHLSHTHSSMHWPAHNTLGGSPYYLKMCLVTLRKNDHKTSESTLHKRGTNVCIRVMKCAMNCALVKLMRYKMAYKTSRLTNNEKCEIWYTGLLIYAVTKVAETFVLVKKLHLVFGKNIKFSEVFNISVALFA